MIKFLLSIITVVLINISAVAQPKIKTCPVRKNAIFQFQPTYNSKSIKLKKGTNVDVVGFEGEYYKVKYKNQIGFIDNIFIYDPELVKLRENKAAKKRANEKQEQLRLKEKYKNELIDKYGEYYARLILVHKVCVGMSKDAAIASWGRPDDINRTITAYGTSEQWVYDGENYHNRYLYFDEDLLKTIQE